MQVISCSCKTKLKQCKIYKGNKPHPLKNIRET